MADDQLMSQDEIERLLNQARVATEPAGRCGAGCRCQSRRAHGHCRTATPRDGCGRERLANPGQ